MEKGKKVPKENITMGMVVLSAPEAVWNPEFYNAGISNLKKRGIDVVEGKTVHTSHFYMAEDPKVIAEGFHEMFLRDDVDAIMCAGGGVCVNKILPFLDFDLIRQNLKPFIGVSNIVAVMTAMLQNEMVSFHGPFGIWTYGLPNTPTAYTHNNLINILRGYTGPLPALTDWKCYRPGTSEGKLVGGNLWTLGTILGTKYCSPDLFDDKILLIEDIGKTFDRLDAVITQMDLLGMLDKLKGVVVGKLASCSSPENVKMEVTDLFDMVFGEYDFPVIYDCDFGHIPDNLCLPIGCRTKMIAKNKPELILLESGVR